MEQFSSCIFIYWKLLNTFWYLRLLWLKNLACLQGIEWSLYRRMLQCTRTQRPSAPFNKSNLYSSWAVFFSKWMKKQFSWKIWKQNHEVIDVHLAPVTEANIWPIRIFAPLPHNFRARTFSPYRNHEEGSAGNLLWDQNLLVTMTRVATHIQT